LVIWSLGYFLMVVMTHRPGDQINQLANSPTRQLAQSPNGLDDQMTK
jgi:hypothetical protein